jgi:hypothetical protein
MKKKITYWITLGLFSLMMTAAAVSYLSGSERMVEAFRHLGYPDYFRIMLGIAKLLGVVALLMPRVPDPVREWAYAGFGITLIAGTISHCLKGDPFIAPLVALVLLVVARGLWTQTKANSSNSESRR